MTTPASSRRRFLIGAGIGGVGVVGAAGGFAVGRGSMGAGDQANIETATDADAGFCTDMATHHVQALAMCQRVLGRDTGDPVQAAATEVLQTQAIEVGMMRAWLADWGRSTSPPTTVMAWMHDGVAMRVGMMPGLATDEQMRSLSLAEGTAQGKMWIELMRAHHVGGVAMAEAAIDLVSLDKVRRLAQTQVDVQTFEIGQYDELLSTVYL